MKNYYDILEVSKKASKDTINKIFKIHMKATHPDLFQGEEKIKAEEKSKELTEAYNVLSDDNERAKYDAELEAEESSNINPQIEQILQENEYLRQVIAKKDEYISRLTGMEFENNQYTSTPNYNNSYNDQYNNYGGFNGFTPPQAANPYEGMSVEELRQLKKEETKLYYKNLFKEFAIKLLIFGLLMLVLIISLMSSFSNLSDILNK